MSQYILLLRSDPSAFAGASPEELQAMLQKYLDWRQSLPGKLTDGHKLKDHEGRVIRKQNVTDGPFAEAKEVMGGFFVVEASSYDEAVAVAKTCPHIEHGSIEIRLIEI